MTKFPSSLPDILPDLANLPDVTELAPSAADALHDVVSRLPFVPSCNRARRRTLWSVGAVASIVAIAMIIRRRRSESATRAQTSEPLAAAA